MERSAIGHYATHTAMPWITKSALPTLMKLSTAKVLGGLGIGLLGWHVALAAGIVALAVGAVIYRNSKSKNSNTQAQEEVKYNSKVGRSLMSNET